MDHDDRAPASGSGIAYRRAVGEDDDWQGLILSNQSALHRGGWMVSRSIIVGAFIAAMFLWFGPFPVPNWAVIGFVFVVLVPLAIVLSVKRMRLENRLARTLWLALRRK